MKVKAAPLRPKSLYRRALEIREKTLGADHPNVALCLNNLAALYYAHGRYAEAEALLRRVLTIFEKELGSAHPAVVPSLNNLASVYRANGRPADAEPFYKRALEIRKKNWVPITQMSLLA